MSPSLRRAHCRFCSANVSRNNVVCRRYAMIMVTPRLPSYALRASNTIACIETTPGSPPNSHRMEAATASWTSDRVAPPRCRIWSNTGLPNTKPRAKDATSATAWWRWTTDTSISPNPAPSSDSLIGSIMWQPNGAARNLGGSSGKKLPITSCAIRPKGVCRCASHTWPALDPGLRRARLRPSTPRWRWEADPGTSPGTRAWP
jgi:hypothetical protein